MIDNLAFHGGVKNPILDFMTDLFNKLLILRTPGIGPVKYRDLVERFDDLAMIVDSLNPSDQLKDSVHREMDRAYQLGIDYLADDDPLYPQGLKEIKNHPPIICVRGNTQTLTKKMVSMVGTRHATAAGMRFMSDLAAEFADHNYAVVSGMAMGTDTAAHLGALRVDGNTQTIAVLAGGADYIWPLENESLYHKIIERGVVISEMPVGYIPVATNFVQRNRWVAGLCEKLILGEADSKSGSMRTARFAIDYKKPVFAIPSHPSDPRSAGPNQLIRDGSAVLCLSKNDFFDHQSTPEHIKNQKYLSGENEIIDRLGIIPLSESVLAELVKKNIVEIKRDLVMLELQGKIKKLDGGYVRV